jgi:hypothetical protein
MRRGSRFAGETACATTGNQQFATLVGQAFSLPGSQKTPRAPVVEKDGGVRLRNLA